MNRILPMKIGTVNTVIMKHRRMRWVTWLRDFRPIKNSFNGSRGDDGSMFETYGPELDFVRSQTPENVWTLLDCDGKVIVADGYHIVNRLGYYVTEIACPHGQQIDVI
jgi:hypothetical protein